MGLKEEGLSSEEIMNKDVLGGKAPVNKEVESGHVYETVEARARRRAEAEVWQKGSPSLPIHFLLHFYFR